MIRDVHSSAHFNLKVETALLVCPAFYFACFPSIIFSTSFSVNTCADRQAVLKSISFVIFADVLSLISVWCFRSERGSWRCRRRSSRDLVFPDGARAPCGCLRHRRHGNASGPARRGQRARRCRLIRARSHGRFPFLGCGLEMIGGVLSVIFFFLLHFILLVPLAVWCTYGLHL